MSCLKQHELLASVFEAGWRETFHKFDPIPNNKTDTTCHGPFSTVDIGNCHPDERSEEGSRAPTWPAMPRSLLPLVVGMTVI